MSAYFNSIRPGSHAEHDDVSPFVNQYLHYVTVIRGHSPQTAFNYYIDLREFFRFLAAEKKLCAPEDAREYDQTQIGLPFLQSVTTNDIYEFLYSLQEDGNCKATTRNRKLSAINGFFKYLVHAINVLPSNPAEEVSMARLQKTLPKYLTQEEAVSVLEHLQSSDYERDYCILTCFMNCGMRLTELCKINIHDIRQDTLTLHGKGNKERTCYLTPACLSALDAWLVIRLKITHVFPADADALFISARTGKRLTPRRVQKIVENALACAGLQGRGISPHKLRHTAATLMYQSGKVDVLELKELLGHANVSTTQIYTHINQEQLREAVNASPLSGLQAPRSHPQNHAAAPLPEKSDADTPQAKKKDFADD